MNVAELKKYLQERGVSVSGYLKSSLVEIASAIERMVLPVDPVKYFFNLIPLRKHNVKPNCSELQLPKMATTLLPKRGSHNYQARQMISIHYRSKLRKRSNH